MKSIYEFSDYKRYLAALEEARVSVQKGFRSRMAEAIGCQSAFVTQVLNSGAHFSLEQGIRCARFIGLEANAEKFFLLLIQLARAGNKELREHFEREVEKLREESLDIAKRVNTNVVLNEEAKTHYYSQWYFVAIHVLVSVPEFQTIEKISEALNLSRTQVQKALLFLTTHNLVEEKNGSFKQGNAQLHLSKNAPQVFQHHQNWRLRAMSELSSEKYEQNLHYSTISSLSEKDSQSLRNLLLKTIEDYIEVVKPSKEETVYAFTLDFFKLIK